MFESDQQQVNIQKFEEKNTIILKTHQEQESALIRKPRYHRTSAKWNHWNAERACKKPLELF
jgi:hypothetical protein